MNDFVLCDKPAEKVFLDPIDDIAVTVIGPMQKDMVVEQHQHEHPHMTFVSVGSVRAIIEGKDMGVFKAPGRFHVEPNKTHLFVSLEDGTMLQCIARLHGRLDHPPWVPGGPRVLKGD